MTKMFLKGFMALTLTLMANIAAADFYIGAGAYSSTLDSFAGDEDDKALSFMVGWEPPIITFLSVEASYHDLGSYDLGLNTMADIKAYSAQGVFTIPIVIIDLYAKLGIAKTDYKVSGQGSDDSSDPYYAIGVAFTMLPVIDIYAEYQQFDFSDNLKIGAYGLGVKANF